MSKNRCSYWYTGRSIRIYRREVWLEADGLYASEGGQYGGEIGIKTPAMTTSWRVVNTVRHRPEATLAYP
jgi:hypothetical protein